MNRFCAYALPFAFFFLVSCTSDGGDIPEISSDIDPGDAIQRALVAMEELTSYRQEFTFRPSGEPVTLLADYADPGDYHERLLETGDITETFEVILVGESTYAKYCDDYPDDCEEWEESAGRPVIPGAGGFTTVGPETLGLVALEQVVSPRAIKADQIEGEAVLHLRGSLNIARTVYENQRRALRPGERFSETCRSSGSTGGTPSQTVCEDLTIEEYYEREAGGTDFEDVPPTTIDIWISTQDSLVRRVVIAKGVLLAGTEEIPPTDRYFEVTYSRFNEVSVEAPE
jgi:hypothetical protein